MCLFSLFIYLDSEISSAAATTCRLSYHSLLRGCIIFVLIVSSFNQQRIAQYKRR